MSIKSEINRISENIQNTLNIIRQTGVSVPTEANSDSLPSMVSEYFTSVSDGKALIAAAVTEKGVETAADASFETISSNIEAIETGLEEVSGIMYDFAARFAYSNKNGSFWESGSSTDKKNVYKGTLVFCSYDYGNPGVNFSATGAEIIEQNINVSSRNGPNALVRITSDNFLIGWV